MYIKNNKGPNILPCGIPLNTLNRDDFSPFKTTHCFLLHRKSVIHNNNLCLYYMSLFWVVIFGGGQCQIIARLLPPPFTNPRPIYATEMTSTCPPESNCAVRSSIIFKSYGTVDIPLIKPNGLLLNCEFWKKNSIILSLIIDSISLHVGLILVIQTGL